MLKFAVESDTEKMGCDPETEEDIHSFQHFVTATDDTGRKWQHCERFATLFEVITEVGEVVHWENRQARKQATELMKSFVAAKFASVEDNAEWSEA